VDKERLFPHLILWICRQLSTADSKNHDFWPFALLLPHLERWQHGDQDRPWIPADGLAVAVSFAVNAFFCGI
jgi:hypothetical protein